MIHEELKRYFSNNGISQVEIAEKLGLSAASVSNMLNGRDKIGNKRAAQLNRAYGFNIQYLITGEGSLLLPDSYRKVGQANGSTFTLGDNSPISLDKEAMYQEKIATLQDQVDTLKRTNEALLRCLENKA